MGRAVLEVTPHWIISLCKKTEPTVFRVVSNSLPEDAALVDVARSGYVIKLVLESAAFGVQEPMPVLPAPVFEQMSLPEKP